MVRTISNCLRPINSITIPYHTCQASVLIFMSSDCDLLHQPNLWRQRSTSAYSPNASSLPSTQSFPSWSRLPSSHPRTMESSEAPPKPRDARTVEAILRSMGVEQYDPRVVNQLLEVLYRYVSSVLTDAREFSEHADKSAIDVDDVRLAIRSKVAFTFTQPPPRDVTMRLAAERNAIPLPPVAQRAGVALPPPEFQLTASNYRVILDARKEKTPQSSPKRPRLTSSPRHPGSGGSKSRSPARSPGSGRIAIPRSAQSPTRMQIDSPARSKLPKGGVILPPAAKAGSPKTTGSTRSPMKTSPVKRAGGTPTRSPAAAAAAAAAARTSPKAAAPAPDVIMLDPAPAPTAPSAAAAAPAAKNPTTPPIGKPTTSPPKKTDVPPSSSPPK